MHDHIIAVDDEIKTLLSQKLSDLENLLQSDVLFFCSPIYSTLEIFYRDLIEDIQNKGTSNERLTVILDTPGGDVITVEKLANINRHFYKEVDFIVPESAMSAGTVFCLSGDKIYMEYTSSLGPIDPQIFSPKQNRWLPALGYIDQMNEAIQKSRSGTLSEAEFLLLKDLDYAFLKECEQHMQLTVQLVKDWLVRYKFKTWNTHRKDGKPVTIQEKTQRAEDIANKLNDYKLWCTHGRFIDIMKLREVLHLHIDDYAHLKWRIPLREYIALAKSYISRNQFQNFFQTRHYV